MEGFLESGRRGRGLGLILWRATWCSGYMTGDGEGSIVEAISPRCFVYHMYMTMLLLHGGFVCK